MNKVQIEAELLKSITRALKQSFQCFTLNFTKKGLVGYNINDIGTILCDIKLLGSKYVFNEECSINIDVERFYSLIKNQKDLITIQHIANSPTISICGANNTYSFSNIDKDKTESEKIKDINKIQIKKASFIHCIRNMVSFSDTMNITVLDNEIQFHQSNNSSNNKHTINIQNDTGVKGSGCYSSDILKALMLISKFLDTVNIGIDSNKTLHFSGKIGFNCITFYIANMVEN